MEKGTGKSKGLSMQTRLIGFVSLLLLFVVCVLGATMYWIVKEDLGQTAEFQMKGHVGTVAKQVGILLQTTNNEEFQRELHLLTGGERKQFAGLGWHVRMALIEEQGTAVDLGGSAWTLPAEMAARMRADRQGVRQETLDGEEMMVAYQFIPERSLLYVAAVPFADTMTPLLHLRNIAVSVGAGALLLTAVFVRLFVRRGIAQPLGEVRALMQKVAGGDLSERIDPAAYRLREIRELGVAVNGMADHLRGMIGQMHGAAEQLAAASEELAASSEGTADGIRSVAATIQEVAVGAKTQAAAAGESAAAMEQVTAALARVVQTSQDVERASEATTEVAAQGNAAVTRAVEQMASISQSTERMAASVAGLEQRSQRVGQIIDVITEIAAQTHLLALNAAIEAARAGEQGRGFAVVADEVRQLAEQSASSAGEISALIREMQAHTHGVVLSMQEGTVEVQDGLELVEAAGAAFERIAASAAGVAAQVQEISGASEQISAGAGLVAESIDEMARISGVSAEHSTLCAHSSVIQLESMEDVFGMVQSLARMAQEMRETIGKFHV
ncbi:HAMP domain-containing methyl-accepting chemotaxis protein [Tumebacillus sp. DT12]|uniref:HAMP domain-containing methyl-accepting chemotaxis protein n=1 Tax=Tumebacillus lacus TaxID=2995335 RepID=A0ABT3WXT4_9BACL|nr:HAMP domain-containing methyl-accepting chemotaxis protein [Tumebacillus lacus]MCX7569489.1 HAMP domain-containing methyl-accepting chemotaxis protein [Tumebacillus lacus]